MEEMENENQETRYSIQVEGSGIVATDSSNIEVKGKYAAGRDIKIYQQSAKPLPLPRQALVPPTYFTGREREINQLKTMLLESKNEAKVLCGMGGVGKTTLAQKVACDPKIEQHFKDGTFWVDLQATDTMSVLDGFARTYGFDVSHFTQIDSRAGAVRSILRDKNVLIVLDNAWREEEVIPLLPHSTGAGILITTRDEALAYLLSEEVLHLDTLTEAEAIMLLEKIKSHKLIGIL